MYFITTKRMLEVCFSVHPNIQYRTCFHFVSFCARKYIDCYEERGLKWPFSLLFWRKEAYLCWKANFRIKLIQETEKNVQRLHCNKTGFQPHSGNS